MRALCASLAVAVALFASGAAHGEALVPEAKVVPSKVLLLGAAKAGNRYVVVGERGRILYSDDEGKTWQIAATPVLATLTAVAFHDDKHGVAIGHRGTLLVTSDGGRTWEGARSDAREQNALLAVHLKGQDAVAVGAYGTYLESHDGGHNWTQRRPLGDQFDRHLNAVVAGQDKALLIAGEAGTLAVSANGDAKWELLKSPYDGSFFGAIGLSSGRVLAFGMRGAAYRTDDNGRTWVQIDMKGFKGAIQGAAELPDGSVVLVGSAGLVATSRDRGTTFNVQQTKDRRHVAAAAFGSNGQLLLTGEGGARWTDFTLPK